MSKLLIRLALFSLSILNLPAHAALNVLACEPEWAALAQELGGDRVRVSSATTALQDPHHIEARPSLIARARNADLLVCTGAELESGWLPVLLRESANRRIQPGQPGHFEAALFVAMLEKPERVDRAAGDVHASGNPHIHTDPRNIARVADALAGRLARIDPAGASGYQDRHRHFAARWEAAMKRWEKDAAPLRGMPVVMQHRAFPYLQAWLGLREVAVLESTPGMEPGISTLSGVLSRLGQDQAKMVIRPAYQNPRPSEWLAQRAKIPLVTLPFTVEGSQQATDLFSLFDDTIQRLLAAAK